MPGKNEEHLARQAQLGDQEAFLELYHLYLPKVYNRVKSRVPVAYVEDVTQDIFIAVVRSLANFERRSRFSTWLYTIVNRQIADFYRRYARRQENQSISLEHVENIIVANGYTVDDMDKRADIQHAFNAIPSHYQEIILMRFADGLTFKDIADQHEQSIEAVKSLYRRAIQALRDQINGVQRERH
ncbi:MAG: RNA polymerase sigma factor [Anaerolineae bacterium]|nr:RNA polymerase sigma factor [Anaerolineae bacterium]